MIGSDQSRMFFKICFGLLFLSLLASPPSDAQTVATLHTFSQDNSEGIVVRHALIQAADGDFYGTALSGGSHNAGTIFKISPTGIFTLLYTFTGGPDGALPGGALIQGRNGDFYGVTERGGDLQACGGVGCGTIFQLQPDGTLTTIYSFTGGDNGQGPEGSLVQGSDGALYGVTSYGGPAFAGTIFRVTLAGNYQQLYAFTGRDDGLRPISGLVQGSDGAFYGTTLWGGAANSCGGSGCGTIYKITATDVFTHLYSFTGKSDGGLISSGLFEGNDGDFYGVASAYGNTSLCSPSGCGTLFKVTPSGVLATLYTFSGGNIGGEPSDALFEGGDGRFYSTTPYDVGCSATTTSNCGTIFSSSSAGSFVSLYRFTGLPPNDATFGGLVQGADGLFYGATSGAEPNSGSAYPSTVYSFTPASPVPAPVILTFDTSLVAPNTHATLHWVVANAFSTTMQQCYGYIQGGAKGAGDWGGLQHGTLVNGLYTGSSTFVPTEDGTYTYALTCGGIESGFATLTVGTALPITITTTSLPSGTVGQPYLAALAADGGFGSDTWAIKAGSLPPGLSLATKSGVISGIPQDSGSDSFTAQVSDSEVPPLTTSSSLAIRVEAATPTVTISTDPSTIVAGQGLSLSATVAGIKGVEEPSGDVQFQSDGSDLGPEVPVLNGVATLSNEDFATPGNYSIVAEYLGDQSYAAASSAPKYLVVTSLAASAGLTAKPPSIMVAHPGDSGSALLVATGFVSNTITFTCSGLPAGAACDFGPLSTSSGSRTASLEITTLSPYRSALTEHAWHSSPPVAFAFLFPLFFAFGGLRRRTYGHKLWKRGLLLLFLMGAGTAITGCGVQFNGTPAGSYAVVVKAASETQSAATTLTLTVH